MVLQEQISGPQLSSLPSLEATISVEDSTHMPIEEGQVPKIRKAYTITKQRERWTDDEHDKFLEALKLHGRAWKKIEEHIGTKTAVQIRSHAQKFFSKVVRVTSSSNASSTDPIEIPPPRPKRKPSHPYPRKHVLPAKKQNSLDKRESQSPTSVLSADSTEPDGSASPLSSSVEAVNPAEFLPSEDTCQDEMHVSANTNDLGSEKLERFPSIDSYDKPEPVSTKVIKLFGKDLVVPINECLSKSPSSDMGEAVIQASPEAVEPMDVDMQSAGNPLKCQAFYCVDGSGNQVEKPVPLPWWVFFQGMTVPQFESYTVENAQEKDGSCVGSSSESVRPAEMDSCWDAESRYERCRVELNKECKASKGFVPYKRCYSGRDMQSSSELCL